MTEQDTPSPGQSESASASAGERKEPQRPKNLTLEVLEADSPRAELARQLETQVLGEAFGNTPEQLRKEYGPYEAASTFLLVFDEEAQKPAGMFRFIHNSSAGLKTINDIESNDPRYPWHRSFDEVLERNGLEFDRDRVLDIGVVVIAPEYQGRHESRDVAYALYRGLYAYSKATDREAWIAVLDDGVLKYTQQEMGAPFQTFEGLESGPYIDSPASTPVYAVVADLPERVSHARDQGFYRKCILGEELPYVEIPSELDRIRP